jgi:amino acid transporter
LPGSAGFLVVQAFTFAVLVLAANTAFQGFPRLAALLARDRFLPHAFANLGPGSSSAGAPGGGWS